MDSGIWVALLVAAIGTFLMRALPMVLMQRHLDRRDGENTTDAMPAWLGVLGPLMIAAMLGASLVPAKASAASWLATALGALITLLVWRRVGSLGWPVVAGVSVYGCVVFLVNSGI